MNYNNNKSLKQKAVCNGVFSESRPLAVKAAKLRIQLPPAESRKPMRAVSAALRLLRAEFFLRNYGWNRGAYYASSCFLQGEAFLFVL